MAVYTELSDTEIRALLARYALPPLAEAQGIRAGVENTNYLLAFADGSRAILTLFEKRVAEADLPFFAGLMERLSLRGIPCPCPLHANDESLIQRMKGKPALIVSFLEGRSAGAIQPVHLAGLGDMLAKMHLAAQGYALRRENALSLSGWRMLLDKIAARLDDITPGLRPHIEAEVRELAHIWPDHLSSGVIHADLFPDNVFYGPGDALTGVIDFYFACNDILAYDLAICLNAWCFEKNHEFNITKAKQLLASYHAVRPMPEEELAALPMLARGAALRFFLTRAHDMLFPVPGALVTPKDPIEYLKKLRFHKGVRHHGEYGL